jgi:hypothetical protein
MTIHDWGIFAEHALKAIEHPGMPVTNKEARLHDAAIHVANNWMAQPKAHGIEGELPLKKLHQCTDAEQILHIIQKSVPQATENTLEGALHKILELAKSSGKKPGSVAQAPPPHVHDVGHDRDVVVGFLQSAIDHIGKLKDISHESKDNVINILKEACHAVRDSASPLTFLTSTENKMLSQLAKEQKKYQSFLSWFRQASVGVERKLQ